MELHIDKVYYWNQDTAEVEVVFRIVNDRGEIMDQFSSYTKAERRICEIFERREA